MTYMLVRQNVDQHDSVWHIDQSSGVALAQVWPKRDISIEWEDGTIEVIPALTRCAIGGGTTVDFTSLFYYIVIGQGAPTSPILAPITDIATFDTAVPDQPWGMLAVCGKWGSDRYWPLFASTPPPITAWTIALIAGGTTDGGIDGPVDGALGINTLLGPMALAYAPDGKLWIFDGTGGLLRTYDPSTGLIASVWGVPSVLSPGVAQLGIALDADGNVWVYYELDADVPFAAIRVFSPDGSSILGELDDTSVGGPLPGAASAISFSPDYTRLYYGEGLEGSSGLFYVNTADLGALTVSSLATVPGRTIGAWADADDNVYSISIDSGGAAKVATGGTPVTNLTNIASGPGYGGDGSAAYTSGDDTPQFDSPTSLAYDSVSNTIAIVDRGNFVIRAITGAGILSTIAGTAGSSGSGLGNFPNPVPSDALTKGLGGAVNVIIPAPDGGFYIGVGFADDAFGVDGAWALYLLTPGAPPTLTDDDSGDRLLSDGDGATIVSG